MDSITSGLPTPPLGGPKFKIQQSVPSASIKRGPHCIMRSANLNDGIEIKRRFGEGSKPLFSRDDIAVNQTTTDVRDATSGNDHKFSSKTKSNRKSSSSETSSPERYRHRENRTKHSSPVSSRRKSPGRSTYNERSSHNHDKCAYNSKFNNSKTEKKRPDEKLPYYRDEQREKDRLRRLYGHSRSRSPPVASAMARRRAESPSRRRRSTSRERHRKHSPYRSSRRDYRSRRSRSRTRSPPQRRDYSKRSSRSSRDRDKGHKDDLNTLSTAGIPAATPQYIPIPVAVPADYAAYQFPGWTAPQPPWHSTPHRPPPPTSHFAPFPMWPMIPPIRPPHQAPFAGMPPVLPYTPMTAQYRPRASQRYPTPRHNTNTYQSRPKKPSS